MEDEPSRGEALERSSRRIASMHRRRWAPSSELRPSPTALGSGRRQPLLRRAPSMARTLERTCNDRWALTDPLYRLFAVRQRSSGSDVLRPTWLRLIACRKVVLSFFRRLISDR